MGVGQEMHITEKILLPIAASWIISLYVKYYLKQILSSRLGDDG